MWCRGFVCFRLLGYAHAGFLGMAKSIGFVIDQGFFISLTLPFTEARTPGLKGTALMPLNSPWA